MNESAPINLDEPSAFISMMEPVIPEAVRNRFEEYVQSFNCSTWIGDRDNIHSTWDGLCYTIFHGMSFLVVLSI